MYKTRTYAIVTVVLYSTFKLTHLPEFSIKKSRKKIKAKN
jgi:hypothetical protein